MPRACTQNLWTANEVIVQLPSTELQDGAFILNRAVHSGSAYQVVAPFNMFIIFESTPAQFVVTIPPGNYANASFATACQVAINGSGAVNTYGCAVNANTGLLTVTRTAGVLTFGLGFLASPRMAQITGFPQANMAAAFVAVVGTFPIRISPTVYYLCSRELSGGQALGVPGAIAILPVELGRFASQYTDEITTEKYTIHTGQITLFLRDEFGLEPVNLNGGLLAVDYTVH